MGWQDDPVVQPSTNPSLLEVGTNAAAKGAAGIVDMFGNAPINAWNLAQGGLAYGREALGDKEAFLKTHLIQQPDLARHALEQLGAIRPEAEPRTQGQRILDTAVQAGVGGLAGPGGLVKNALTGALSGAAAQITKEKTGSDLAATAVGALTPLALRIGQVGTVPANNPLREQTFREGRALGYKLPPSEINPSFLNNRLESIGGKAAIKQQATLSNQAVTDAAAVKDLGLPKGTPLTEAVLNRVRKQASQPYQEVAALSPTAADALEELKKARLESKTQWQWFRGSGGNPDALKAAQAADADIATYEQMIEQEARAAGRPELVSHLHDARTKIAKTYDVEKALNLGDASMDAGMIGRSLDKAGVDARSGNLATVGKFQQAFPKFMGAGAKTPSPGVSYTDMALAAGLGLGGYGATESPYGAALGLLPFGRGAVRSALLSNYYQNRLIPESLRDTGVRSALIARAIAERNP